MAGDSEVESGPGPRPGTAYCIPVQPRLAWPPGWGVLGEDIPYLPRRFRNHLTSI